MRRKNKVQPIDPTTGELLVIGRKGRLTVGQYHSYDSSRRKVTLLMEHQYLVTFDAKQVFITENRERE